MVKHVLLSLLGAVILFFWGFIGHVAIGLYDPHFNHFEQEAEVAAVLEAHARGAGIHYFPAEPARDGSQAEALINYVPAGERSGFGSMVGRDLLIGAVTTFIVLLLVGGGQAGGYWPRVGRFTLAGLAMALFIHGYYWIWFDFPLGYFLTALADTVMAWTLVGLGLAAFLRPPARPG
jgi:hypothetical protein